MFQQWKRQKDTESETEVGGIEDKGDEWIGEMKQDW